MKRTPLRRVSKKRAKLMRTAGPERRAYKEEIGCCQMCRKQLPAESLDCHEIASGAAREACLTEWSLVLVLCRACHDKAQHQKPGKQISHLALWYIDTATAKYNELKGTAPTHVDRNTVLNYLDYSTDKPKPGTTP